MKVQNYEPCAGEDIDETAQKMAELAAGKHCAVRATFNDIVLTAKPTTKPHAIVTYFWAESNRRREKYLTSPEYAERYRQAEEDQKRQDALLKSALLAAPTNMTLRDEVGWKKAVEANPDPYGSAVMQYAEMWARLMEARIVAGDTVEACADEASHIANTDGITGFMYGCAVSILSQVWIHGEALRRWHNLKTQIRDEGEKANAEGGVLNPALLCIGA